MAESLVEKKLTTIGTVRRNKTFLLKKFQKEKALQLGQSKFRFRIESVLVSYQTKRPTNVPLLNTMHNKGDVCTGSQNQKSSSFITRQGRCWRNGSDGTRLHKEMKDQKMASCDILEHYGHVINCCTDCVYDKKNSLDTLSHDDNRQNFNMDIGRPCV